MKNSVLIGETDHGNRAWVGWNAAALAAIALLALALSGCGLKFSPLPGPGPEPKPTPTPEPTPPPVEECLPGLPWCHELVPPATCGECKHNPTSDPAHCEKAPKCEEPPPVPQGCILAGVPTQEAVGHAATLQRLVFQALVTLRPDCETGGTCLLGDETQQVFQARVEAQLRKQGLCAGQHGPGTDEIAVAAVPGDPWEGYDVFTGDDSEGPVPSGQPRRTVVWAVYRGAWLPPGMPAPPPPSACPEPKPPIALFTRIAIKRHTQGYCDTTEVLERACEYCASVGLGRMPDGSLRCTCPVRVDEHPDRRACEASLGEVFWETTAGTVEVNPDNPAQARSSAGGQVRKCRKVPDGRTVCSEWCS